MSKRTQLDLGLEPRLCKISSPLAGLCCLRAFVGAEVEQEEDALLAGIKKVLRQHPWRQMQTPGGRTIRVRMSNCGAWGWSSDRQGYRYRREDPLTGRPWMKIPPAFFALAQRAAARAGYADFRPDACLMNRYTAADKMGLHKDADEQSFEHPIVSVSLGLEATFAFGGPQRSDSTTKIRLAHGDVLVWGGEARCHYHGITRVHEGEHARLGALRINLTFRRAGE